MKNYRITVNGNVYDVEVEELGGATASVSKTPVVKTEVKKETVVATGSKGSVSVTSPMPGKILAVKTKVGNAVKKGEVIMILEAMKMENEIMAPHDATVAAVHVNKGETVESGTALVSLA